MTRLTNQISAAPSVANQNSPTASSAQQKGNQTELTNHAPTTFKPPEDTEGNGDGNSATPPPEKESPKER